MEDQQQRYRVYEDSGQIVKLDLTTKQHYRIWPKELKGRIEHGECPPFWNDEEVLTLLSKMLSDRE